MKGHSSAGPGLLRPLIGRFGGTTLTAGEAADSRTLRKGAWISYSDTISIVVDEEVIDMRVFFVCWLWHERIRGSFLPLDFVR